MGTIFSSKYVRNKNSKESKVKNSKEFKVENLKGFKVENTSKGSLTQLNYNFLNWFRSFYSREHHYDTMNIMNSYTCDGRIVNYYIYPFSKNERERDKIQDDKHKNIGSNVDYMITLCKDEVWIIGNSASVYIIHTMINFSVYYLDKYFSNSYRSGDDWEKVTYIQSLEKEGPYVQIYGNLGTIKKIIYNF